MVDYLLLPYHLYTFLLCVHTQLIVNLANILHIITLSYNSHDNQCRFSKYSDTYHLYSPTFVVNLETHLKIKINLFF